MTEDTTAPAAPAQNFDVAAIKVATANLTDASKIAARDMLMKAGATRETIGKTGLPLPPEPGAAGSVGGVEPVINGGSNSTAWDGVSQPQRALAYKNLLTTPGVDVGNILANALADGIKPPELGFAETDVAKDATQANVPEALRTPAQASDYLVANKQAAEAMHKAGVPTSMGRPLADSMNKAIKLFHGLDENAATLRYNEEMSRVASLTNKSDLQTLAREALAAFPKEWVDRMMQLQAFSTAESQAVLASIGSALRYRKGK